MKIPSSQLPQVYQNVMEELVQEEIEKQLKFYPSNLKCYINRIEVATYALNRLPPLYASCQVGKEQQKRLGKQKYKEQITAIVRRSLAAIERDPLRKSTPIISQNDAQYQEANIALKRLQNFLAEKHLLGEYQQLSWDNLTRTIQNVVSRIDGKNQQLFSNVEHSLSDSYNCQIYTSARPLR